MSGRIKGSALTLARCTFLWRHCSKLGHLGLVALLEGQQCLACHLEMPSLASSSRSGIVRSAVNKCKQTNVYLTEMPFSKGGSTTGQACQWLQPTGPTCFLLVSRHWITQLATSIGSLAKQPHLGCSCMVAELAFNCLPVTIWYLSPTVAFLHWQVAFLAYVFSIGQLTSVSHNQLSPSIESNPVRMLPRDVTSLVRRQLPFFSIECRVLSW